MKKNASLSLTDEEVGFLYGNLYRVHLESARYRRRRSKAPLSEAEKAARAIETSVRAKLRKALVPGAARAIEVMTVSVL